MKERTKRKVREEEEGGEHACWTESLVFHIVWTPHPMFQLLWLYEEQLVRSSETPFTFMSRELHWLPAGPKVTGKNQGSNPTRVCNRYAGNALSLNITIITTILLPCCIMNPLWKLQLLLLSGSVPSSPRTCVRAVWSIPCGRSLIGSDWMNHTHVSVVEGNINCKWLNDDTGIFRKTRSDSLPPPELVVLLEFLIDDFPQNEKELNKLPTQHFHLVLRFYRKHTSKHLQILQTWSQNCNLQLPPSCGTLLRPVHVQKTEEPENTGVVWTSQAAGI